MGLDVAAIRQLLAECQLIDEDTPEKLLEATLGLLYPTLVEIVPSTPPMMRPESPESDAMDQSQERKEQEELDIHVLYLLRAIWVKLSAVIRLSDNAEIIAVCQREQGLFLLRILHNKTHIYTLTDRMMHSLLSFISQECLNLNYAEQLLERAARAGDVIAQLCRVRRLLLLCERGNPLQAETQRAEKSSILQCFDSWVMNNTEIKSELDVFSKNLSNAAHSSKQPYAAALNLLIHQYRSDKLTTVLAAQQPILVFLQMNMSILKNIDVAFRGNWNEIRMIPVASKQKAVREKYFGEDYSLNRTRTMPRSSAAPGFFLKKCNSEPKLSKADFENQSRRKNPRDFIFDPQGSEGKSSKKPRV